LIKNSMRERNSRCRLPREERMETHTLKS
jgi:hypothetical protein